MAVINPPGFLQNAGATHTAEQMRNHFGILTAGKQSATSLIPRGGVNPTLGNALSVTQTGSPSMAVIVKSGAGWIAGSEGTKQGVYSVLNDGDVTLSIAAAHATLNRIDLVCFKVEDQAYSGSTNASSLVVVTGTPAGSPVAPTAPNNSLVLAQVSVVALDTSITNGEITDKRTYGSALGGVITCTSATRPAANTVISGQLIYENDTSRLLITYDAGASWQYVAQSGWGNFTPAWTSTGSAPSLGNGGISGRFIQIGKTVSLAGVLVIGSTTTFGTGDYLFSMPPGVTSGGNQVQVGSALLLDSGTTRYAGSCATVGSGDARLQVVFLSTNYMTGTAPITLAVNDIVWWGITLEVT